MNTIQQMFAVFDDKSKAFEPPFCMSTIGLATRAFSDSVNNPESPWHRHPEDYTLFHLGEFDTSSAAVNLFETPTSIGLAQQFKETE